MVEIESTTKKLVLLGHPKNREKHKFFITFDVDSAFVSNFDMVMLNDVSNDSMKPIEKFCDSICVTIPVKFRSLKPPKNSIFFRNVKTEEKKLNFWN